MEPLPRNSPRCAFFLAVLTLGTLFSQWIPRVSAALPDPVFRIPSAEPGGFDEVEEVVKTGTDPNLHIPANLEEAQCGGWDFFTSITGATNSAPGVLRGPPSYMAEVSETPGRVENPIGNITSGMGERIETGGVPDVEFDPVSTLYSLGSFTGYQYPNDACGFSTTCRPTNSFKFRGPQVQPPLNPRLFPNFMCRHTCERPLGNPDDGHDWDIQPCNDDEECEPQANCQAVLTDVRYSCGGGSMPTEDGNVCPELQANGLAGGLAENLNNRWLYNLYTRPYRVPCGSPPVMTTVGAYFLKGRCGNPNSEASQNEATTRAGQGWSVARTMPCCSDTAVNLGNPNLPGHGAPTTMGRNTETCAGQNCRFQAPVANGLKSELWVVLSDAAVACGATNPRPVLFEPRQFVSYFRHYPEAAYERAPLGAYAPDDDASREAIPISCYNMYAEIDAKKRRTFEEDKSCVIAAYYEENHFRDMPDTQLGKGFFGKPSDPGHPLPDPDYGVIERRRPRSSLWDENISGTFSLLESEMFTEDMEQDFTVALLATDNAQARAIHQVRPGIQPLSSGALVRAFDDTVTRDTLAEDICNSQGGGSSCSATSSLDDPLRRDRRTIVEWWQELENEMWKRLTPPVARLLLPEPKSIDLDVEDPFLSPEIPPPSSGPPLTPSGSSVPTALVKFEGIEKRVHATEDLVGDVAGYLERLLILRIVEEPLPIVVPMGSPTEFRAYAQGWQSWVDHRQNQGLSVSGDAYTLISRLEEYAVQIERSRALRGALASYVALVLNEQRKIMQTIASWLDANVTAYQQYLATRQQQLALSDLWKVVQDMYREFHDKTNFAWCRNDRFTTSIYSLLDPWMPGPQIIATPTMIDVNPLRDITARIFDGSPTPGGTPPYLDELPRLQVQRVADIALDLSVLRPHEEPILLPVLKPIQIRVDPEFIEPPAPKQDEPTEYPALPALPPIPDLANIDPTVNPIASLLPKIFAGAALPDPPRYPQFSPPTDEQEVLINTFVVLYLMNDEYKLFWDSILEFEPPPVEAQDCLEEHKDTCVHFEGDLMERLVRLGDRPAVFLREDFFAIGKRRDAKTDSPKECPREDWGCTTLNELEVEPRVGWTLTGSVLPTQERKLDILKRNIVEMTVPFGTPEDDLFPYLPDVNDVLPSFRLFERIDITPEPAPNENVDIP